MKQQHVRLCGIAAMVLTLPASAQTQIVLDLPLDWQVIQRNAQEWAEVKVAGTVPADAAVVEAKAGLGAGMRGKAIDWTVVAKGTQVKDGRFSGSLKLLAGGWYALKVRFRKSAADPAVLGEAAVEHVGVGDIFVVAGQSNASNHGAEQQKTTTGLVAASDGKRWQLANDPQPGASGGQGSFQPPFGDAIAGKFKVPVGIIACGIGATSVSGNMDMPRGWPSPTR
ncbi:MAG: hypothetical protein NTW21_04495 [Verrucomicrobia bacterium]|nr:hypothetical protein [Verrucomicrobiota bacterium]